MTIFDQYFKLDSSTKALIAPYPKLFLDKELELDSVKLPDDLIPALPYDSFSITFRTKKYSALVFIEKSKDIFLKDLSIKISHYIYGLFFVSYKIKINVDNYNLENIVIETVYESEAYKFSEEQNEENVRGLPVLCLYALFELQSQEVTGYTYRGRKEKIKHEGQKIFTKPELTVVILKKDKKDYVPPDFVKDIKWDYSFPVRGHWRTVSGLGKDPNGNRNQPGRTWVTPHIRGEGEVSNHLRVYK